MKGNSGIVLSLSLSFFSVIRGHLEVSTLPLHPAAKPRVSAHLSNWGRVAQPPHSLSLSLLWEGVEEQFPQQGCPKVKKQTMLPCITLTKSLKSLPLYTSFSWFSNPSSQSELFCVVSLSILSLPCLLLLSLLCFFSSLPFFCRTGMTMPTCPLCTVTWETCWNCW